MKLLDATINENERVSVDLTARSGYNRCYWARRGKSLHRHIAS